MLGLQCDQPNCKPAPLTLCLGTERYAVLILNCNRCPVPEGRLPTSAQPSESLGENLLNKMMPLLGLMSLRSASST